MSPVREAVEAHDLLLRRAQPDHDAVEHAAHPDRVVDPRVALVGPDLPVSITKRANGRLVRIPSTSIGLEIRVSGAVRSM